MALTLLILGIALATFAMRLLPLAILGRLRLPAWATDWLALVPGAILAALLAQSLFVENERLVLAWDRPQLLAALPAVLVAWRTRNVLLTMLTGMGAFALLQHWLG